MALPTTWLLPSFCLLVASTAAAQSQPPTRERQARRTWLPATPAEPLPELYVAAGNLTTVAFNGPLDRDSLVVDRTRFKWADVGDRILTLEPFADLGSGERLIVKIGFKDRALPAQAVLAVVTQDKVMDGSVEVDRRANTPEALLAALAQKEAELEELKARSAGSGPVGLALSGWLYKNMLPVGFSRTVASANSSGLEVLDSHGYPGQFSTLVTLKLRNLPNQKPWLVGQVHLRNTAGASVKVLSLRMKPSQLGPGETDLLVVEAQSVPWSNGREFSLELVDASGQRRLSLNLLPH
ncbi:DUF2381 family protein [Hyalangium rubrum]|uniref:DUF2381 family protein n=1 Tax=Hyalangium rubrum TaxID=3103134 RepID=A0ABU5HBC3_9BACT|nr:DUF2381 family protein [Hyalangium sp. s54d21]MDY7230097.1 DUF2381 family protein [Hyalangium sp. s54d21]